jgi:Protein of unknown function (DUF1651)
VLHFRPRRYDRWSQSLEVTFGEVMAGGEPPLLKKRRELTREQAIKLWAQKRQQGCQSCSPQWALPVKRQPRDGPQVTSMGRSSGPPCF